MSHVVFLKNLLSSKYFALEKHSVELVYFFSQIVKRTRVITETRHMVSQNVVNSENLLHGHKLLQIMQ